MGDETTNPTMYCGHCKKEIPVGNFTMHEVHCRRNIVLCPRCNEPVPQKELDEHVQDVHATEACSKCGQQIEKSVLDQHKAEECPKRNKRCEFCDIEFAACDFVEHEKQCGSRTEPCEKCKRRVCLRDLPHHQCLPEASSTNQEKVCIYCGRSVDSSAYQQHVDGCGSAESQCDSCQLPVLMQNMAAHLGSDCTLHVIGASREPSRIGIPSSMFFASKPSINGIVLGAEPDIESSGDGFGAIGLEFSAFPPSRSFRFENVRLPTSGGTSRGGVSRPKAAGLSTNSDLFRSPELPQQTKSNPKTGSQGGTVGQSTARALPTDPVHRKTPRVPATDRSREAAVSPYGLIAPTGLQTTASSSHRPFVAPGRSESSAASGGTRVTVQPERNAPTRLSAASTRSSTTPKQSVKAVEVVKIPVKHHPVAIPFDELHRSSTTPEQSVKPVEVVKIPVMHHPVATPVDEPWRQRSGTADALSKGNERALLLRPQDVASAGPPDDDEDSIPCQLCGEVFPLDVLRDHQEFCGVLDEYGNHVLDGAFDKGYTGNPQRAMVGTPYAFLGANYEDDLVDTGVSNLREAQYTADATAEVQLPCEFCDRLFASHELNVHQATCRSQPTHLSRRSLMGPTGLDQLSAQHGEEFCNYCLKSFPQSAYHEASCIYRQNDY